MGLYVTLQANKARVATVLAFRADPAVNTIVTVKGKGDNTYRVAAVSAGHVLLVRQRAVPRARPAGAASQPGDIGASFWHNVGHVSPVP